MKVTALLPDEMVEEVRKRSGAHNITESLKIALGEWLALQRIRDLNKITRKKPLQFQPGFSAAKARALNRRVRS
jgi:hypothetical protein